MEADFNKLAWATGILGALFLHSLGFLPRLPKGSKAATVIGYCVIIFCLTGGVVSAVGWGVVAGQHSAAEQWSSAVYDWGNYAVLFAVAIVLFGTGATIHSFCYRMPWVRACGAIAITIGLANVISFCLIRCNLTPESMFFHHYETYYPYIEKRYAGELIGFATIKVFLVLSGTLTALELTTPFLIRHRLVRG